LTPKNVIVIRQYSFLLIVFVKAINRKLPLKMLQKGFDNSIQPILIDARNARSISFKIVVISNENYLFQRIWLL